MVTFDPNKPDRWPDEPPTHKQLSPAERQEFIDAAKDAGALSLWELRFADDMQYRHHLTPKQGAVMDKIIAAGWLNDPALWKDSTSARPPPRVPEEIPEGDTFSLNLSREDIEVIKTSLGVLDFGE